MSEHLIELLKVEMKILNDAADIFKRSYNICKEIGLKDEYSLEELDHFEALTSRFARLSDILIQKIFRLVEELDLEISGTIRDRLNLAEKKELIVNAETFVKIRLLRNEIAHEYMPQAFIHIFAQVVKWAPELLETVSNIQVYTKKFQK